MDRPYLQYHLRRAYKRFSPIIEKKRSASYLTITLTLFSLSFFGLFAIRPTLITATSLIKSVSELRTLDGEYEKKISNVIQAQSEYEQIRDAVPLIETALPSNPSSSKLAISLERFTKDTSIKINQLQIDGAAISTPSATLKLETYGFTLVGTGDFQSIFSFLTRIINWRRLVKINSFELSSDGKVGSESASLRMIMKAVIYYEP